VTVMRCKKDSIASSEDGRDARVKDSSWALTAEKRKATIS
jgi:hypothetical protein